MKCHRIPMIVNLVNFRAEMSQDANMVTWGGMMVHISLERSDRVDSGHCHLIIGYRKEYTTPLQQ